MDVLERVKRIKDISAELRAEGQMLKIVDELINDPGGIMGADPQKLKVLLISRLDNIKKIDLSDIPDTNKSVENENVGRLLLGKKNVWSKFVQIIPKKQSPHDGA